MRCGFIIVPRKGTPLENEKGEPLTRQNRLYNVDFLVRCYNYSFNEFNKIMDDGMLPNEDPKTALAKATFEGHIDINEADYQELIRIPGIGPKAAKNILSSKSKITKYEQLKNFGAQIQRAKPFISVDGKKQMRLCDFG